MPRLTNKVAIITGAAQGLGRAMALRFAEEGCNLALSDLNLAGVQETARLVAQKGVSAIALQADVTQRAEVERMVAAATKQLSPLDILVNNAGIFFNVSFEEMTDEQWQRMVNVNLTSVFLVSQIVIRHWLSHQRRGSIINLASISASVAFTDSSHYCASKAGVAALTRCLAMEFGPVGIRANSMAPGIIETEMTRPALSEPKLAADWKLRIPLREYGQPEDVANLALFLASDESRYLNGEMIYLDGGAIPAWSKPSDAERTPRTNWG